MTIVYLAILGAIVGAGAWLWCALIVARRADDEAERLIAERFAHEPHP